MENGRGEFLFSNQHDSRSYTNPDYDAYNVQDYFLTLGFLPCLEVTGRVAENSPARGRRDLSGSLKVQLPFYRDYLPKLAFGIQDFGGKANNFQTKYAVLSQEFWRFRASLGYGLGPDRLEGLFGGVEFKAHEWLYLLAENDSVDTHVGLRLNTPRDYFDAFSLALYAKSDLDAPKENYEFGVSLQFDLGKREKPVTTPGLNGKEAEAPAKSAYVAEAEAVAAAGTVPETEPLPRTAAAAAPDPARLAEKLAAFGFENITVGVDAETILIAYENNVLDYSELDGVGVVLHLLLEQESGFEKAVLVLRKSGMDVASITFGSLEYAGAFLREGSAGSHYRLKQSVAFSSSVNYSGFRIAVEKANSSLFKTRIELSPGLKTYVGTEYGLFDYLLSLRTYVRWNLYKGVDLDLLYDTPLLWSDDLDRRSGRYRSANRGNELQSLMLNNTDSLGALFNTLSLGRYKSDYLGAMDQVYYQHGRHKAKLKLGYFENRNTGGDTRKVGLASYSYAFPDKDLFLEATGGQFWYGDRGYSLEAKRFFGDTLIGFFFIDSEHDNFAGINVEIPLTFRKVANNRYVQLKGKKDFSYYLRSTVMREDNTNTLNNNAGIVPVMQSDIENDLFDRGRLNQPYLEQHLYRIKDAYDTIALPSAR